MIRSCDATASPLERDMRKFKKLIASVVAAICVIFMMTMIFNLSENVQPFGAIAHEAVRSSRDEENHGNSTLVGSVLIDGKIPMSFGTVLAHGTKSPRPIGLAIIQPSGVYRISDLPIGHLQLVVTTQSHASGTGKESKPHNPLRAKPTRMPQNAITVSTASKTQRPRPEIALMNRLIDLDADPRRLIESIDALYGSLAAPRKITTLISEGENRFDINLDMHSGSEAVMPESKGK